MLIDDDNDGVRQNEPWTQEKILYVHNYTYKQ